MGLGLRVLAKQVPEPPNPKPSIAGGRAKATWTLRDSFFLVLLLCSLVMSVEYFMAELYRRLKLPGPRIITGNPMFLNLHRVVYSLYSQSELAESRAVCRALSVTVTQQQRLGPRRGENTA